MSPLTWRLGGYDICCDCLEIMVEKVKIGSLHFGASLWEVGMTCLNKQNKAIKFSPCDILFDWAFTLDWALKRTKLQNFCFRFAWLSKPFDRSSEFTFYFVHAFVNAFGPLYYCPSLPKENVLSFLLSVFLPLDTKHVTLWNTLSITYPILLLYYCNLFIFILYSSLIK